MTDLAKPRTDEERARHQRLRARMGASEADYHPGGIARRPEGMTSAFDPNQPRAADGKWSKIPGSVAGKVVDGSSGGKSKILPGTSGKSLTLEESQARGKMVDRLLRDHRNLATDRTHADWLGPGKGVVWKPERDRIHRQIVDDVYRRAVNVPNRGQAIIMGGPMGAGKTTTVQNHAGVDLNDYLIISPDDMKDELAKRGLVPEIPGHPEMTPLEASTLVHAETMRLASMLAHRAYRDQKNVVWDISMGTSNAVYGHLNNLRNAGYGNVEAIVVDVSPETSRRRAYARYQAGVSDWLNGDGNGGRYIPRNVLDDQHDHEGQSWGTVSLGETREAFDRWRVFSNDVDGQAPSLVDEG